jgi:predicted TIM-barrel fold metal-dependent hydrolase
MNRREFALGTLATAAAAAAQKQKYSIIDAQIHVWTNDPQFPWDPDTKNPPKENRTPAMALELMKANGVQRTVIAQ